MRLITPHNLQLYGKCPKKADFSWSLKTTPTTREEVVGNIVKAIYLYQIRHERVMPLKRVSAMVDRSLRKLTKADDPEYRESKGLLSVCHKWYENYYLQDYLDDSLVNLPVFHSLDQGNVYGDTLDIVGTGRKIRVFDFREVSSIQEMTPMNVYNDLLVHTRVWGLYVSQEVLAEEYVRIYIGPHSISPVTLKVTESMFKKTRVSIEHMLQGICRGIFYPSMSEQCARCPYNLQCSF